MNMMQIFQMMNQFRSNPQQLLQRFGIPQQYNSPDSVAKYLVDSGKVTQQQIEQAKSFFGK